MENGKLRTLVIMPAWNESEVIADTLARLKNSHPDLDVLVVDDGSTDSTAEIARSEGAHVLTLPYNLGVGGAMRLGYKYALRNGYDQAIQVDSDGQHNPDDIDEILAGLDSADISIGARFANKGNYQVNGPRKWAMVILASTLSHMANTRLTDTTSGFRACNKRGIEQYSRHYPAEYLGDTIDSLVLAIRAGCKVTQVPVEMKPRQAGTPSSGPFRSALYLARAVFALMINMTKPVGGDAR